MFTLRDRRIYLEGEPILAASIPYFDGADGSTNNRAIDPSNFDETLRHIVELLNDDPPAWFRKVLAARGTPLDDARKIFGEGC